MKPCRGLCIAALLLLLPMSGFAGSYPPPECGAFRGSDDWGPERGVRGPFAGYADLAADSEPAVPRLIGPSSGGSGAKDPGPGPCAQWDPVDGQTGSYGARTQSYRPGTDQGYGRYSGRYEDVRYPYQGQPRDGDQGDERYASWPREPRAVQAPHYGQDRVLDLQGDAFPMKENRRWSPDGRPYRFRGDAVSEARDPQGRVPYLGFEFRPLTDRERQREHGDTGWRPGLRTPVQQTSAVDGPPAEEAYGFQPDAWFQRYYGTDR